MLIDVEWIPPENHPLPEFKCDTTNGGLYCTFMLDGKLKTWAAAVRCGLGLYAGHGLDNTIREYSKYDVVHPWDYTRELFDKRCNSTNPEERDALWIELRSIPESYGRADNLQQIFRRGRYFVRSPKPYVLEVRCYDNTNEKNHKQGPYIGKKNNPPEVIAFSWHELKLK